MKGFETCSLAYTQCIVNQWKGGVNAGGQVSQQSFHTNPKIEFSIPPGQEQQVKFTLMKANGEAEHAPIGLQAFEVRGNYFSYN